MSRVKPESKGSRYNVLIEVAFKEGVRDAQGATVEIAVTKLGFDDVSNIRINRAIRFSLRAEDEGSAREKTEKIMESGLLGNPAMYVGRILRIEEKPEEAAGNK